jgi:hypothetical protein
LGQLARNAGQRRHPAHFGGHVQHRNRHRQFDGVGNNTTVIVEGGAVNATGRFGVSVATKTHLFATGSAITVCTIGNTSGVLASFDLGQGVGPDVVMSGGTVTIRINCTGVPPRDYRNQQGNTAGYHQYSAAIRRCPVGRGQDVQVEGCCPTSS